MIAQEQRPLARCRDVGRLPEDVGDRKAVFLGDRHVDARHQREVIGHMAFVAMAEIFLHVLRPLVGLGQQDLALGIGIELLAQPLDDGVRLRQVLVVGAVALAQIGDGVEPEAVDAGVEPALHHLHDGPHHARIVEIEVRLVREEAMPVELAGLRIPGPVRLLGIGEDDPRIEVFLVGIAPDIPAARARIRRAAACALEPRMLVRSVVDDEFGDDAEAALLGLLDEALEVLHRAEIGIDVAIITDVVAVVAAGRGIERQQPQRGDAELLQIAEFFRQPGEVADAVIVAVGKRLDMQLVDDRVLVPELIRGLGRDLHLGVDGGENVHDGSFRRHSAAATRDRAQDRDAGGCLPIRAHGACR